MVHKKTAARIIDQLEDGEKAQSMARLFRAGRPDDDSGNRLAGLARRQSGARQVEAYAASGLPIETPEMIEVPERGVVAVVSSERLWLFGHVPARQVPPAITAIRYRDLGAHLVEHDDTHVSFVLTFMKARQQVLMARREGADHVKAWAKVLSRHVTVEGINDQRGRPQAPSVLSRAG